MLACSGTSLRPYIRERAPSRQGGQSERGTFTATWSIHAPELKSFLSTSATFKPLLAASRATPAPVAPPPTTSKSNSSGKLSSGFFDEALSLSSIWARDGGVHGGGGRRVSLVEGGYEGPEFRYQYPPADATAVEPVRTASVRLEKRARRSMLL